MSVSIPIPGLRLVSEANSHTHWRERQRRAKQQREIVSLVLRRTVTPLMMTMAPLDVIITRIAPSRGLDDDNLAGSAKHVRDQVAAELGIDDRDPRVTWRVEQQRGPWGIRISVAPTMPIAAPTLPSDAPAGVKAGVGSSGHVRSDCGTIGRSDG